jgi:hypothetical protein
MRALVIGLVLLVFVLLLAVALIPVALGSPLRRAQRVDAAGMSAVARIDSQLDRPFGSFAT